MERRVLQLVLMAAALQAQPVSGPVAGPRWIEPTHEEPAGTKYQTFFSKTLNGRMSFLLYLPPRYSEETSRRYPVLYWLPGGQQNQLTAAGEVAVLDKAIRDGKIAPMIIVAPHGPSGSMWTDSHDGKEPVETVIVKDLVAEIDANYRTIPKREGRWIEGFSLGGRGASHLAFEYPEEFGAVSDQAGAVAADPDFFSRYEGGKLYRQVYDDNPEYYRRHDPSALAEKNAEYIRSHTLVRIMVGDQDKMGSQVPGRTVYQWNQQFHVLLQRLRIDHEYFVVPGVGHAYQPLYKSLGDQGLEFFRQASARLEKSAADSTRP